VGAPPNQLEHSSPSQNSTNDSSPTRNSRYPSQIRSYQNNSATSDGHTKPIFPIDYDSPDLEPPPCSSPAPSSPYLPTVAELLNETPSRGSSRSDRPSFPPHMVAITHEGNGSRNPFTSRDIRELLSVVCDVNPFMAGNIGKKWVEVGSKTRAAKACLMHSDATIQKKVTALLEYQKVFSMVPLLLLILTSPYFCRIPIRRAGRRSAESWGWMAGCRSRHY
jgi:hypothetical protein